MKLRTLSLVWRIGVCGLMVAVGGLAKAADCNVCHSANYYEWIGSRHANTQVDVATGLAEYYAGQTAAQVLQGEDCIACHAPTSVLIGNGLTEEQAMANFFTTSNGVFTAGTVATNTGTWGHVDCFSCHYVPQPHEFIPSHFAVFDSRTGLYSLVDTANQLCAQCHGNLRFTNTDRLLYNAWSASKHALSQTDVATELGQKHAGQTPDQVIASENCIACHSPTSVLVRGGGEALALGNFFSTTNGVFSPGTYSVNTNEWPGIACTTCHDPHQAGQLVYFNSTTQDYQSMTNAAQLCGQCHGNLRFPDTDHLSYNILTGTGGIGVTNQVTMPGVSCTDCHMYASGVDGSNSKRFHGHSWAITVDEGADEPTTSCTACHAAIDTFTANAIIDAWRTEYQALDLTAAANVARAAAALQGSTDTNLLAGLTRAQFNLKYAESDESGGFHNHQYLMALLKDANTQALLIPTLSAGRQGANVVISWTGQATLQSAQSLAGPWQDLPSATNPLVIPPGQQNAWQFYRLKP